MFPAENIPHHMKRWLQQLASMRLRLTFSHLWRVFVVALLLFTYVAGMWAGIVSPTVASAATLSHQQASVVQSQPEAPRRGTRGYASSISPCPSLSGTPTVSGSADGLGTLGFYTFVKQNLDDRLLIETNVTNGNLVAQYTALQIHGTGIDLDIAFTYNSQSTASGVLASNWNLSVGNGVSLTFNNGNATLHGSSGFSAPYTKDSNSYDGYDEPPGLDATLLNSSINGASYVLVFQKTGECFGFNSSGQEMFDQDKNGHQITFAYNGSGNLSSVTDTQNRLTTFGYNAKGEINLITDPISRTVQLTYSGGVPTTITDLAGKTTTLAYSGTNLTGITDPNSNTTNIFYQTGNARVDHLTDALGNTSYYAYYSPADSHCTNQIPTSEPCTTYQDANSHTTLYGYSGLEVEQVIDANGNLEQSSYTPDANVKLYTDPLLDKSTFNFDVGKSNNLLSITDGNGGLTQFGYGNSSHPYLPTTINDAQGNQTSYGYDSNGNLTSATDSTSGGTGSSASYTYNTSGVTFGSPTYGLLIKAKDGDGNVTQYTYDSEGNLKTVTPPSPLGAESLTVDSVSRVKSVTDGNGNTISFSYDNLDRLTQITYPSSTISDTYDADGNQTSIVDNTGTTSFTYDHDNRLKKKTLPNSQQLSVTYDPVGNVSTYTDSGGTVTYSYDPANRVTQVQEPDSSLTTYGYNNANEKTSISYPNGTGELFGYDKAGHITSAVAGKMSGGKITTTYASYVYTYSSGSTSTDLVQTVTLLDPVNHNATYTRDYSYDAMNRLTDASVYNSSSQKVQDWSYVYDKAGNRIQSSVLSSGATTTYSYNGAEELTKTVQGSTTVTYSYDGNGNLTSSTDGNSFTYNKKNQTSAIDGNSYTYSGPDQTERVQLNSTTDAYSGLGLSYETTSGSTTYYTRCSCGLLINERLPNSGGKDYYLFDGQGSVVGLTDSNGSEVNAYDYDPYGVILNTASNPVANPFQYAGGYFESSTGLLKFGTRYYNPALGRWTQQDPVGGSLGNSVSEFYSFIDSSVNLIGFYLDNQAVYQVYFRREGKYLSSYYLSVRNAFPGVSCNAGKRGCFPLFLACHCILVPV